jgi:hypothetical protein
MYTFTDTPVRSRAAVNSQRAAMLATPNTNYQSSRRSSEDSVEEGTSLRDVRVSKETNKRHTISHIHRNLDN